MGGITLYVTAADGSPAETLSGELTVDGVSTSFDCGAQTGEVLCGNGMITLQVEDGETLEYTLADDNGDAASGDIALEWTKSAPNGEECGPICYSDAIDITLEPPSNTP